ncbi:MAG: hypothetical protein JF606_02245 [Burkholderiales bacterium]|nr:hypothetical protein [Burkholderiales bacterium]
MKRFKMWPAAASLALASLLSACGGGNDSTPPPVPTPVTIATVSGTVRDASGAVAPGVHVTFGTQTADTDASGTYSLNVPSTSTETVLSFAKTGYAGQTRKAQSVSVVALQAVDATLTPIDASSSFNPAAVATLSVPGSSAQVTLSAGSLVRSNGSAPTGPATAELTVIDASKDSSVMPGNYLTGAGAMIESNGALQVNLFDADGATLNLAEGKTATIRIPAVSRGGMPLPTTIPLFYFDDTTGVWVQEGSAALQGTAPSQYYEGAVSHFTVWNADRIVDVVYINGCVQESGGARVAKAMVVGSGVDYIGSSVAITDATGAFRIAVKKSATTRLYGQSLLPYRYGPTMDVPAGATDVTMPNCLVLTTDGVAPALVFPPVPPGPTPVGDYAGSYSGTFSGAESGTFAVTLTTAGVVVGSGHSATYNFDFLVNGNVSAGGSISLNATAGTAGASVFTGSINVTTGAVTGTWRYSTTPSGTNNGTFTGTRG